MVVVVIIIIVCLISSTTLFLVLRITTAKMGFRGEGSGESLLRVALISRMQGYFPFFLVKSFRFFTHQSEIVVSILGPHADNQVRPLHLPARPSEGVLHALLLLGDPDFRDAVVLAGVLESMGVQLSRKPNTLCLHLFLSLHV